MNTLRKLLNQHNPCLLLEDTRCSAGGHSDAGSDAMVFVDPIHEIHACNREELKQALEQLDALRQQGLYLAGVLHYEAAYCLIPKLDGLQVGNNEPLLHFYAFRQPQSFSAAEISEALDLGTEHSPLIRKIQYSESRQQYLDNIGKIRDYIYEGDSYQVNHTLRLQFDLDGSVEQLYRALRQRQRVAYSAWLKLPDRDILSLSPELFIEKRNERLKSRPMKGTAPRGQNPFQDKQIRRDMASDKKQLSENLMIVDLIRNDIGRLARPGSMQVKDLFRIEDYETVFQMVSTISGEINCDTPNC